MADDKQIPDPKILKPHDTGKLDTTEEKGHEDDTATTDLEPGGDLSADDLGNFA